MIVDHIFKDINHACNFVLNKEKNLLEKRRPPLVISPRRALKFNPFQVFFNDADDDKFVVTRLQSGRYSLKPNLRNRYYLFRGQNKYFNPSKPSMFRSGAQRFLLENIAYQEMFYTIYSHPLVQLLDAGIILQGHKFSFEMNLYGLTQHYYNKTSLLDLTASEDVAKFFAVTDYSAENDSYTPHVQNGIGVLYYYEIGFDSFWKDQLKTIGLQVFPRSFLQKGFLRDMSKTENFNDFPQVSAVKFYHNASISKKIFDKFHGGKDLFPIDILEKHWKNRSSNVISQVTYDYNARNNPHDNILRNRRELEEKGWRIADYSPSFSSDELHSYYQDIKNGWWEDFCSKIFIPVDKDGSFMKDMLSIENLPEYEWAFKEEVNRPDNFKMGMVGKELYPTC